MDKKQYCYILYDYKNVNTVELRWLELEGTAKMCSSYRKFEPPRSHNFREKKNLVLTQDTFITLC